MIIHSNTAPDSQNVEITNLKKQILDLQTKVEISSDTINILEKKLSDAEAKAMKTYKLKKNRDSLISFMISDVGLCS